MSTARTSANTITKPSSPWPRSSATSASARISVRSTKSETASVPKSSKPLSSQRSVDLTAFSTRSSESTSTALQVGPSKSRAPSPRHTSSVSADSSAWKPSRLETSGAASARSRLIASVEAYDIPKSGSNRNRPT